MLSQSDFSRGTMVLYFVNIEILAGEDEIPTYWGCLQVLEVSSNHLQNLSMSNLVASQVNLLDISGNPNLLVSSHDLDGVK